MKKLIHFLVLLVYFAVAASGQSPVTVKVGIIMDLTTPVGRGTLAAVYLALSDFSAARPESAARIELLRRHSPRADTIAAASAALDLLSNDQVAAILGPQTSASAAFVADLGARARVPVVSFSATSPSVSPAASPFFIRASPSDASMGPVIAALALQFSWRRIVPIYEDSDFGSSLLPNLVGAFSASGDTRIPYRCPIPATATDDRIGEELYRLKTLQTRVFVLHAPSALAARILSAAAAAGMTDENYAWILTAAVAGQLGSINPAVVLASMQGAVGVRPFIRRTKRVRDFEYRWRLEFLKQNPNLTADTAADELSPFVYYAYDTFWAVAAAADTVIADDPALRALLKAPPSSNGSSAPAEISRIGVSDIGPKLLKSIREIEFDGISGRFSLVDGELNVSAFQIVNVNGETAREVGFWTPSTGLSRNLKSSGGGSTERGGLGPVIWSGESMAPPKGWDVPTGGEKMRIAVPGPVDPGFQSFLSLSWDPNGKVIVGGYVIEVFEACVRRLPYALPLEYISWANVSGNSSGDYTALVKGISEQKFDGVVGDVTITLNRSEYADFTFPYTMSGISMVVPVRNARSHRAWIFLDPLTTDLWLASGAFFVFTGIVVWFLEHRINPDFRGPPSHQFGTVFYFSFSTLVFAHKEAITSNLSRLVLTIWVFVVLILTSSYTASLTSMLTVRQFQPTITDFRELIANGKSVGFLRHSFVRGLLVNMSFNDAQLKPYKSPQAYKDALSNGTVAAIIDEIPYLKLFLKNFCDNFTMGSLLYKTSGFGFVFPKGSSLVPDLSRAILNLTESQEMIEIERRWFGDPSSCPNPGSGSLSSNSLDLNSFYGLFLITGVTSILALLIYAISFFYRYRDSLAGIGAQEKTMRRRMTSVAKLYDQKDLHSHTFKNSPDAGAVHARGDTSAGTSPRFDVAGSESPFTISLETETSMSQELATSPAETSLSQEFVASPADRPAINDTYGLAR